MIKKQRNTYELIKRKQFELNLIACASHLRSVKKKLARYNFRHGSVIIAPDFAAQARASILRWSSSHTHTRARARGKLSRLRLRRIVYILYGFPLLYIFIGKFSST